MAELKIGAKAPNFSLKNQAGETVKLSELAGKTVVLYFYPKALTPGCTTQACGMRDVNEQLLVKNVVTLAVSPDPVEKLAKFSQKHNLNFDLLSDPEHKICEKYGIWQLKKFMGKEYMGVVRTTFIIDPAGKIQFISPKVNTKTHHEDVLARV